MRIIVAFAFVASLAACVRTIDTPAITGFNGDMVLLQGAGLYAGGAPLPEHTEAAQELCATRDKDARFGSSRRVGELRLEYTFICL
jgi:hypothetical protein